MDRREFIKQSTLTVAAFGMSGLTTLIPREAQASAVDVSYAAEGVFKNMVDGTSILSWQFRDLSGFGPGGLSSGLVVMEGDAVDITVHNDLDRPINLEIRGDAICVTRWVAHLQFHCTVGRQLLLPRQHQRRDWSSHGSCGTSDRDARRRIESTLRRRTGL